MQFPISIELHRSRFLSFLLILFHSFAAACASALPWPWPVRLPLLGLIGASAWLALRPHKIVGLRLYGRDRLDCLLADGSRATLAVLPDSTVFDQLIVLRLRIGDEERIRHLALLPDQISTEQFRVLRLWLRWHTDPKADAEAVF